MKKYLIIFSILLFGNCTLYKDSSGRSFAKHNSHYKIINCGENYIDLESHNLTLSSIPNLEKIFTENDLPYSIDNHTCNSTTPRPKVDPSSFTFKIIKHKLHYSEKRSTLEINYNYGLNNESLKDSIIIHSEPQKLFSNYSSIMNTKFCF